MNRAKKRQHYVVEKATDIINFTLERGDTVYNMEDGMEYIHTSYYRPLGYTLQQLIVFMSTDEVETTEEDVNTEEEL